MNNLRGGDKRLNNIALVGFECCCTVLHSIVSRTKTQHMMTHHRSDNMNPLRLFYIFRKVAPVTSSRLGTVIWKEYIHPNLTALIATRVNKTAIY